MQERMMAKAKRAAIYLRVSTGEQTVGNQRRELEAAAASRGWSAVAMPTRAYPARRDARGGNSSIGHSSIIDIGKDADGSYAESPMALRLCWGSHNDSLDV
jgi:hypothetical protein